MLTPHFAPILGTLSCYKFFLSLLNLSIENIKTLTKDLNIPWFAVGGIKSNNISYLKRNGFKKVALVSQLMNSEDPREAVIIILKELSHEN